MNAPGTSAEPWATWVATQLESIDQGLARRRGRHLGVHAARKAIRRLRSLLALGKKVLGPAAARVDLALRRLARGTSVLRDAQVAVEIADRKRRRSRQDPDQHGLWQRLRRLLSVRRKQVLQAELKKDPLFASRRRKLHRLGKTLLKLDWSGLDQKVVRRALQRARKRTVSAEQDTLEHNTLELRHRWRRRARRLRMQLQMLKQLDPVASAPAAESHAAEISTLEQLVDRLGAEQDLHLLRRRLAALPPSADRRAALKWLNGRRG